MALDILQGVRTTDIALGTLFAWLLYKGISQTFFRHGIALKGPPRTSYWKGYQPELMSADDSTSYFEKWYKEYGPVFSIPWSLGGRRIALMDPRAISHFYSKEPFTYVHAPFAKATIEVMFGKGILVAEREDHRRQRKALTPAFSNAAIRRLTSVFYESALKLKVSWDSAIDASADGAVVFDVTKWMSRVSLDSIGIAGFSHDFKTLDGENPPVAQAFDSFGKSAGGRPALSPLMFLLGPVLPILVKLPTKGTKLMTKLRTSLAEVADELLEKTRKEKLLDANESEAAEKSIIGQLINAENKDTGLHMTQEEVIAQMNTLLLAGYLTTSISLTWALIELCRRPEVQDKLRQEVLSFGSDQPTWDQLMSGMPYLDAVVHEVLRLHPPVKETVRTATEDDIIPLSQPITTPDGKTTDRVPISKGSFFVVPIAAINKMDAMWGPNADRFAPERWLDESRIKVAKELQGHRHLLTFSDGPRICIGKNFAVAEFKAVLLVLIRNFAYELPDGPDTKFVQHRNILPVPKREGETDPVVPLRIRRVDA